MSKQQKRQSAKNNKTAKARLTPSQALSVVIESINTALEAGVTIEAQQALASNGAITGVIFLVPGLHLDTNEDGHPILVNSGLANAEKEV